MAGTSIEDDHVLINAHAVFPFPTGMQDVPIELRLEYPAEWEIGTPLDTNAEGAYLADDYDHFVDSPLLLGRLSYASTEVTGVPVEIYTYSVTDRIRSEQLLEAMDLILQASGSSLASSRWTGTRSCFISRGRIRWRARGSIRTALNTCCRRGISRSDTET